MFGPPRLAVLAAQALQSKLLAELGAVKGQYASYVELQHSKRAAAAAASVARKEAAAAAAVARKAEQQLHEWRGRQKQEADIVW